MSDTSDKKEITIEERAELWASLLFTFDTGQRYGKKGYIQGFHDCQQLYGGLTPEQVKEAVELLKLDQTLAGHWLRTMWPDHAEKLKQFLSTLNENKQ